MYVFVNMDQEYRRLRLNDLKALLAERGVDDTKGLNKAGMVQKLLDLDEQGLGQHVENDAQDSSDEEEAQDDNPRIKELQLMLELEKLRTGMRKTGKTDCVINDASGNIMATPRISVELPKMSGGSETDFLSFITAWEKAATLAGLPPKNWAKYLPACLNDTARKIFALQSLETCVDYMSLKRVMCDAFQASAEVYQNRLTTMRRTGTETYKVFAQRLVQNFELYLKARNIETLDDLKNDCVLTYFLNTLTPGTRRFVMENQPGDIKQASNFADLEYTVSRYHASDRPTAAKKPHKYAFRRSSSPVEQVKSQEMAHSSKPTSSETTQKSRAISCFNCGENHKARFCDKKVTAESAPPQQRGQQNRNKQKFDRSKKQGVGYLNDFKFGRKEFITPIILEGQETDGYRDTGANTTLIRASLVPAHALTGKFVEITGITGKSQRVQLATVRIRSPRFAYNQDTEITVAAVPQLPYPAILGNDMFACNPHLRDIVQVTRDVDNSLSSTSTEEAPKIADNPVATDLDDSSSEPDPTEANDTTVFSDTRNCDNCDDLTPIGDAVTKRQLINGSDIQVAPNCQGVRSITTSMPGNPGKAKHRPAEVEKAIAATNDEHMSPIFANVKPVQTNKITRDSSISTSATISTEPASRDQAPTINAVNQRNAAGAGPAVGQAALDTAHSEAATAAAAEFFRMANINFDDAENQNMHKTTAFKTAQQHCPTLKHYWTLAKRGSNEYVVVNDLLWQKTPSYVDSSSERLLMLPQNYLQEVLRASHDSVFAGHLGVRKTLEKVSSVFAAPKLRQTVQNYIRSCHNCQVTSPLQKNQRYPLQPVIISGEAFENLMIDILGSEVTRTKRGNRFVLIAVCVNSRFVQAFPLRNQQSKTVANALLQFFSFVGLPKHLSCDNQSSLKSDLMSELYTKLGVKLKTRAPFHSAATGLAERYVRSIGDMTRKFLDEHSRNWDDMLPHLCMALNSSKNPTLGCCPSQLVFGHPLRGALHFLRDAWTETHDQEKVVKQSVSQYLQDLQERIELSRKAAESHAKLEQKKVKDHFDRHSTPRSLSVGEQILLLQPSSNLKMRAVWQGPGQVLQKLSETDYLICIDGRKLRRHINHLKKYYPRETIGCVVIDEAVTDGDDTELDLPPDWEGNGAQLYEIGSQLTASERSQLETVLNKFKSSVFADRLGCTDMITHTIRLTDEAPCRQPTRRIPDKLREPIIDQLRKMLADGVLTECDHSEHCCNIVPVRRGDGSIRLTADVRLINAKTMKSSYKGADPRQILNRAASSDHVSVIDLKQFFHQIKLSKESQKYTCISTPIGFLKYQRLAMGLSDASKTAQILMERLFRDKYREISIFIDDLVVHTKGPFTHHVSVIEQVLNKLREAGLTANKAKCRFAVKRLSLLGHVIEAGKIFPGEQKVAAIAKLSSETITTKRLVRAAVGLISYFRNFIPRASEIMKPLTDLLKANMPERVRFTQACHDALETARKALTSRPCLIPPDYNKEFHLFTDASANSIGSMVGQEIDGKMHPIAFSSHKLTEAQKKWSVVERELYAVVKSVTQDHYDILYNANINLYTDHRPLAWLHSLQNHNPKLMRWALMLQNIKINPQYLKGERNVAADLMSRI